MKHHYDEVAEQASAERLDRVAAESRLREAQPYKVGAPDQMSDTPLHKQDPDKPDCLLQTARMAEHKQTGKDPGLETYKDPAIDRELYDPVAGTDLPGFVEMIDERPGLEAQLTHADGPLDIKEALDSDKSVIVGVDAPEFYRQYNFEVNDGGHALVITGAEQSEDGSWYFTVNDPNQDTPNIRVDSDAFLQAWDKAGRSMITVQAEGGA